MQSRLWIIYLRILPEAVFLNFWEPRNRFQGIDSASLCSLAGRYDNPIPTRFPAPIDSSKIPAQERMALYMWGGGVWKGLPLHPFPLLHPVSQLILQQLFNKYDFFLVSQFLEVSSPPNLQSSVATTKEIYLPYFVVQRNLQTNNFTSVLFINITFTELISGNWYQPYEFSVTKEQPPAGPPFYLV
jgi:hypothetical protein